MKYIIQLNIIIKNKLKKTRYFRNNLISEHTA